MHTVSPPATILVTGANGFLGLWQVRELLNRGYRVRGSVRSADKGERIKTLLHEKQPLVEDRFEYIVVPDITKDGAFDEAVTGVDSIIHGASPITLWANDPQELIAPAVGGTTAVLKSALKHGTTVRRVVITGSVVTMMRTDAPPGVYDENDWNDYAVREVEPAWEFYNAHKHEVPWDLTSIGPSFVFGPLPEDPASPDEMVTTASLLWSSFFKDPKPAMRYPPCFNYVDVRDVTEAFIRALEVEAAGGERIVATARAVTWQDWLDAARDLGLLPLLEKEDPNAPKGPLPTASNAKSQRLLGIKYKSLQETVKDTVADFASRGWLKHLGA
ncbi:hypothetical protein ACG7TL_007888 [Trametes sanguinea]